MLTIGIDNGLSGGIAALSSHSGAIIATLPMPTLKRGKFNEIDGLKVVQWIRETCHGQPTTIVIEDCPEHAQQKSTMRSMGISYGILVGAITATGLPRMSLAVVRSGNPKDSWQLQMLGKVQKGQTKVAALATACVLWPDETWLATARSKTPHSGIVDAALIAEHWRKLELGLYE